jgi:hypothetical protein
MSNRDTLDLNRLKPLTTEQSDAARRKALERVTARIGSRPSRKDFQRELGSMLTLLDALALLVFIPALTVSSIHIIQHMGALANVSYAAIATYSAGTVIGRDLYTAAHQWLLIPLAEASMLLFLVMFTLTKGWRRVVFLALAIAAVLFVTIANVASGIGSLESVLAPLFTIGIGLHLESLIVRQLERRSDVSSRYLAALSTWEAASQDATKHPDYLPILKQELWARLMALTNNKPFADAPAAFRHAAVRRELERDMWAFAGDTVYTGISRVETPNTPVNDQQFHTNGTGQVEGGEPVENPLALPIVARPGDGGERA